MTDTAVKRVTLDQEDVACVVAAGCLVTAVTLFAIGMICDSPLAFLGMLFVPMGIGAMGVLAHGVGRFKVTVTIPGRAMKRQVRR